MRRGRHGSTGSIRYVETRGLRRVGAGLAAALCVLLTACSDGAETEPEPQQDEPGQVDAAGLFFGECGGVSADELMQTTGISNVRLIERNSVGCRWEDPNFFGARASFSWYRGSPIGRERALVELSGRDVFDVSMQGPNGELHGFAGRGVGICEVSIESESDFFVWSVVFDQLSPPRDMCERVEALAEMTVTRAE